MSDATDLYRDLKSLRKEKRRVFGIRCPMCRKKQPRRDPTILLPQQRCRVDGYRDPRPELTTADYAKLFHEPSDDEKLLGISGYYPDGSPY